MKFAQSQERIYRKEIIEPENLIIKVPNKEIFIPFLNERSNTGRLTNRFPSKKKRRKLSKRLLLHDRYIYSKRFLVSFNSEDNLENSLNRKSERKEICQKFSIKQNTSSNYHSVKKHMHAGTKRLNLLLPKTNSLTNMKKNLQFHDDTWTKELKKDRFLRDTKNASLYLQSTRKLRFKPVILKSRFNLVKF
jgi:hypothetical protein